MIIDFILGNNVDTIMWISELQERGAEHIIVVDYDCSRECVKRNNISYVSTNYAREYMKKFDTVHFYKSLYAYPGMQGNMSSLYKNDKN